MIARLLLAVMLLALPGVVWADPITLFIAAEVAFGATVAGVIATVYSYGAYILVAANYVYGGMDARRRARNQAGDARRAYNAGLQDRNASVLQADPAWRVVYGKCRTGGDIVGIFTSDKAGTRTDGTSYTRPDALKHLVIVVAAHQVDDITEMYIDGVAVGALDGSGWATTGDVAPSRTYTRELAIAAGGSATLPAAVTVLSAVDASPGAFEGGALGVTPISYSVSGATVTNTGGTPGVFSVTYTQSLGTVRWSKHLGTASQTVDTYLTGEVPSQWTAADRLRGLAYVVVTLDLEDQRWQGGPPQMAWDVRGRLCFDPRDSGTRWTENPALIVRDYLTAPWGFECTSTDIDDSYTIASANACDVSVSFAIIAAGITTTAAGATYTCNGALVSSDSRERTLSDLCDSMAGFAVYGARWQIMAGYWSPSVLSLGDDDLAGQIDIVQAGAGLDEVFNGVRGSYVPSDSGVPSDFAYANSTFVSADGRELWTEITLPFSNFAPRCRSLARIMVEANRDSLVIRFPAKLTAWPLQVGDRVAITSAEYGFSAKLFRVTDWQFGLQAPVMLTLQEDASAIYDLADAATADPAPNTGLPNPWVVAPVSSLSASSGTAQLQIAADGVVTPRVLLNWAGITGAYVADGSGHIEVLWRRVGFDDANTWRLVSVPGDARSSWIVGANDGDVITVAVTVINGLGARSDARYLTHTVVGKTQLPVAVSGLAATALPGGMQLSWTASTELDYRETEIRVGGASWAAGTLLFKGAAAAYLWPWPALGSYTIRAKHRDSTGNESSIAVSLSVTVDASTLVQWAGVTGTGKPADYASVAGGGNLVKNPTFLGQSSAHWNAVNKTTITGSIFGADMVAQGFGAYRLNGVETGYIYNAGTAPGSGVAAYHDASPCLDPFAADSAISVQAGRWYQFSALVKAFRGGAQLYVRMNNSSGSAVGYDGFLGDRYTDLPANGTYNMTLRQEGGSTYQPAPLDGQREECYQQLWFTYQAVAGSTHHAPFIRMTPQAGTADAVVFVARVMFTEVAGPSVSAVPFDLGPGIWAGKQLADTVDLSSGAATVAYGASASGINVTGNTGVPTGDFTDLVSYTWTPPYTCEVQLTVEGSVTSTTPASGGSAQYAVFSTRIVANASQLGPLRTRALDQNIGYSNSVGTAFSRVQRFTATGGVSYTVKVQGQQLTNLVTCTVNDIAIRIEEIRR